MAAWIKGAGEPGPSGEGVYPVIAALQQLLLMLRLGCCCECVKCMSEYMMPHQEMVALEWLWRV